MRDSKGRSYLGLDLGANDLGKLQQRSREIIMWTEHTARRRGQEPIVDGFMTGVTPKHESGERTVLKVTTCMAEDRIKVRGGRETRLAKAIGDCLKYDRPTGALKNARK
jgi:hypothetical protein